MAVGGSMAGGGQGMGGGYGGGRGYGGQSMGGYSGGHGAAAAADIVSRTICRRLRGKAAQPFSAFLSSTTGGEP